MKRLFLSILMLALISPAFAKDSPDKKFVEQAAQAGMAEVELANQATQKSANDSVREYAQHLQQEHQQANEKLKSIAGQKNIDLPSELDRSHKRAHHDLAKLEGRSFDREFIAQMIKDHKDALDTFQREAKKGKDPELKAFAAETEPALRQHLEQAQALKEQLKSAGSTGSTGK